MKTILHLIETKGPGGAETVFINLFGAFDGGDFRSVALVAHGGWQRRTTSQDAQRVLGGD